MTLNESQMKRVGGIAESRFAYGSPEYKLCVNAILAALSDPTLTGREWLPIESAPKDGTEFLAYGLRRGDAGYTEDELTWTGCKWHVNRFIETKPTGRYSNGFTPTLWMPMPPAPGAKEEA